MSESVPGANDEEWAIIEKHTTAIGVLTIYTAMLDFVIGGFVNKLMQIDEQTGACVAARFIEKGGTCETAYTT